MNKKTSGAASVAQRIEAIEEAYEFMLAYAARGLLREEASDGGTIRGFLQSMAAALDGIAATALAASKLLPALPAEPTAAFIAVLADDAAKALTAVRLVTALPAIGSQTIDNLNANSHLRATLADLFLIDDIGLTLRSAPPDGASPR
jgi:hypothetical protein